MASFSRSPDAQLTLHPILALHEAGLRYTLRAAHGAVVLASDKPPRDPVVVPVSLPGTQVGVWAVPVLWTVRRSDSSQSSHVHRTWTCTREVRFPGRATYHVIHCTWRHCVTCFTAPAPFGRLPCCVLQWTLLVSGHRQWRPLWLPGVLVMVVVCSAVASSLLFVVLLTRWALS